MREREWESNEQILWSINAWFAVMSSARSSSINNIRKTCKYIFYTPSANESIYVANE